MSVDFMNPAGFLFLLLIPLVYTFRKIKIFSRITLPLTFSDWNGWVFTWDDKLRKAAAVFSEVLTVVGFLFVVTAYSEPVVHHQEKVFTSRGTDVLFVLDTSPSMAARDINGITRLEAAVSTINKLVESNPGASYGLVVMGSEAASVVPLTNDIAAFKTRLAKVQIGSMGDGTAIGTGLSSAVYHIKSTKAKRKCIVILTDGENNAGEIHPETAGALAKKNGITLYTVGIGTKGTVPIEYVDPNSGKVHSGYYDSEFDSSSLEEIALAGGGTYFGIESTAAFAEALNSVSRKQNVFQTFHYKSSNRQLYSYFLIFSAIVFFAAWFIRRILLKEI